MSTPFVPPDFLNESEESIHKRMRQNAPPDVNTEEGDIFFDTTRPTAIEKAEMIQLQLTEAIKVAFPQWSYGVYLDMLAEYTGITRHPAVAAGGTVTFNGITGTIIPSGIIVATVSDEDPSIEFRTSFPAVVGDDGSVEVEIQAIDSGPIGNVAAGSISIMSVPIRGISAVSNLSPTTGGTPAENDDSLRERIIESQSHPALSGAKSDYIRWAREVPGVGQAYCFPEWNGPGTVKVVIMDANGEPANQQLIDAVQEYIAPAGRDGEGLAPIGHLVTVDAPATRIINVSVKLITETELDQANIIIQIEQRLRDLLMSLAVGSVVRITQVGAVIVKTDGVRDYEDLLLNGSAQNVELEADEVPILGAVERVD